MHADTSLFLMYSYSLRAAARISRGAVPRPALRPFGGATAASAVAAPGCLVPSRGRSASSSTSAASSGMEQPKQHQDAVSGENTSDGAHKGHWDPITQSFGEGYSTRADEEGFGTVYARPDDDEDRRSGHPAEYDTSQGREVSEKEKGRHLKDDDDKHKT